MPRRQFMGAFGGLGGLAALAGARESPPRATDTDTDESAATKPTQADFGRDIYTVLDDFDDTALFDRDGPDVTPSAFDVIGQQFRPEWYIESGVPYTAGGELILEGGEEVHQTLVTSIPAVPRRIEFDYRWKRNPAGGGSLLVVIAAGGRFTGSRYRSSYQLSIGHDGDYSLGAVDEHDRLQQVIESEYVDGVGPYTARYERRGHHHEVFRDGVSGGTAVHRGQPDVPGPYLLGFSHCENTAVYIDNLRVA